MMACVTKYSSHIRQVIYLVTAGAQRIFGQGAEYGSRWMDADRQGLVQSVPD